MTPEQILACPPTLLSQAQREHYFDTGAIGVPSLVDAGWLARCRQAVQRLQEQSRHCRASNDIFDLEPGHSARNPRLRRINSPCDHDPVFWDLLVDGPLGDLAADLLGPDVKFFQSKLNFKAAAGGTEVRWHQDAPFFRTPTRRC
ncbi:MAG: phytanoyl-CoA dioxygenase family protein [Burkholderiaceae bacterium]